MNIDRIDLGDILKNKISGRIYVVIDINETYGYSLMYFGEYYNRPLINNKKDRVPMIRLMDPSESFDNFELTGNVKEIIQYLRLFLVNTQKREDIEWEVFKNYE
jgi:hypothetical protein